MKVTSIAKNLLQFKLPSYPHEAPKSILLLKYTTADISWLMMTNWNTFRSVHFYTYRYCQWILHAYIHVYHGICYVDIYIILIINRYVILNQLKWSNIRQINLAIWLTCIEADGYIQFVSFIYFYDVWNFVHRSDFKMNFWIEIFWVNKSKLLWADSLQLTY